jgi:hypothetical protein
MGNPLASRHPAITGINLSIHFNFFEEKLILLDLCKIGRGQPSLDICSVVTPSTATQPQYIFFSAFQSLRDFYP